MPPPRRARYPDQEFSRNRGEPHHLRVYSASRRIRHPDRVRYPVFADFQDAPWRPGEVVRRGLHPYRFFSRWTAHRNARSVCEFCADETAAPHAGTIRRRGLCRDETNLHPPVKRLRNPVQHRKGMPLIIGVLQPADRGCARPHHFCQFPLGQSGLGAQLVDFPRHRIVRTDSFQFRQLHRITLHIAPVQNFNRVARLFFFIFGSWHSF